ncbi:hypothetical protein TorRG33x02_284100 [Trema orientale]|uniref:Uncharacterized protein n=1 Tax=Trema orientale TaxID=63057 RepID=A0A2P5CI65_TREOI|nr:hypothetical protein TorRG33x02_284100 [Trema orientale]
MTIKGVYHSQRLKFFLPTLFKSSKYEKHVQRYDNVNYIYVGKLITKYITQFENMVGTSNMSKKGKTQRGTEMSVFLQQLEQSETAFSFFFSLSSKQIMDFADFKLYRKLSNPDLAFCLKYTLDIAKLTRQ